MTQIVKCDSGGPPFSAIRSPREFFTKGIKPGVGLSGYRPDWMDTFYLPRALPSRTRTMRRLNGTNARPLAVSEPDDRRLFRDASYPWGCIGSVHMTGAGGDDGSGVLVGRNLVVTAAHLIPWHADGTSCKFTPAEYLDEGSLHGPGVYSYATEVRGFENQDDVTGYDWAILRLAEPLGDMVGFLGWNDYHDDWEDLDVWTVVGYPSHVGPFYESGISISDDDDDAADGRELESENADISHGNSGGPIFASFEGDHRIIGLVSGERDGVNIFAGGPGLRSLIEWGRSNW